MAPGLLLAARRVSPGVTLSSLQLSCTGWVEEIANVSSATESLNGTLEDFFSWLTWTAAFYLRGRPKL